MLSRRELLLSSTVLGLVPRLLAAAENPPGSQPSTQPEPRTAAARALYTAIGAEAYGELLHRLQITNRDYVTRGFKTIRAIPGVKFVTGYPYNEFYDWDLYFENVYLSYFGVYPYCFTNLREFLNRQTADGYVNRSLIKQRDRQHFKPFLAQLVVLGCKQNHDDYAWLKTEPEKSVAPANGSYYHRLKLYIDKWFSYDGDGNGLPAWNSADAAGTDNQWSRAGKLGAFEVEGVDLASLLIRDLRAMAVIATHLEAADDAATFNNRADKLVTLINETFWDEAEGFYYDRNEKTKQLVKVKSVTSFLPLYAGAATPERAKRIVQEHLLNEKEFWLRYPIASYAKTEPDYYQGTVRLPNGANECNWRGPTWAPMNYMVFHGLRRYGFEDVAKDLAGRLLEMALEKNRVLREYYNAETGEGIGQTQFWGFTALYYVMLLEYLAKYDVSDLTQPFVPLVTQELGVVFPAM